MGYSVGIGLTNECNLSCAHCYRDTDRVDRLSLDQVRQLCTALSVDAVGLGTGENALHPDFIPVVEYLAGRGVKLGLASNGYSLMQVPNEILRAFNDVEVSIDFPTEDAQDAFRGPGNWTLVHRAMERCRNLSVETTILATMMATNYDLMDQMVALARRNSVYLRVNAYQAVKSATFRLTYEAFWEGYRRLFAAGLLVSCSEPVVRAALRLEGTSSPCGRSSVRISPRGMVIPCVYWPLDSVEPPRITDLARLGAAVLESPAFEAARFTPPIAAECPCRGGCASRRALGGRLDAHDEYCPWVRADDPLLAWRPARAKDLMRSGNVCTTIVE